MNKLFYFFVLLFSSIEFSLAQNTFTSVQTGDWNDGSTWSLSAGAGGVEGVDFPAPTDFVIISDNDTVYIDFGTTGILYQYEGFMTIDTLGLLWVTVGDNSNGFALINNGKVFNYGKFYTGLATEGPGTPNPFEIDIYLEDNAVFYAFEGSDNYCSDDIHIRDRAIFYTQVNVCIEVDDDFHIRGTNSILCGDGGASIGASTIDNEVIFESGANSNNICNGLTVFRGAGGTCNPVTGTPVVTGTGPSNLRPIAIDDNLTVFQNTAATIDVLNIGINDFDFESDTIEILQAGNNAAINDNQSFQGGTLSINNNGTPADPRDDYVDYTPPLNFIGFDSFRYIIEDLDGAFDTALVYLKVICVNGFITEDTVIYPGVITSIAGVGNSGNILGAIDGLFADWFTNGNTLVYDFGSIQAVGTKYLMTWRERTGETGTAIPIIEESTDNVNYFLNNSSPSTNSTVAISDTITSQNEFRYLRISKNNPPSTTDFQIDALGLVEFNCSGDIDTDGDGVFNFFDIDDDNDGILDIDEGICEFTGSVDAYWPMDNSTDDASGNNRNAGAGTNAPPFSTDAIQGTHSANFNGTNHVIRYSVDGEFMEAVYNTVSFSAWIKPSSLTGTRIIYEEGGFTNGLALWLNGNTLTYSARNGGAGSQTNIAYTQTLSLDGIWHHVACTFNNGVMKLYLDGVPETTTAAYTTIPSHTSNGGLGGDISDNASGALGNYAGLLDAARYSFTEVWSDARIALEAEPLCDSDGDGIPNKFDLDSDNDGIPDIIEAGGIDIDGDGRVDAFADTDGDGWADTFDPDNGGTPLADEDQDGDGLRNRIDIDSDNDGIIDNIEAQASTASPIVPTGIDSDNDGVDNAFDIDNGGNFLVPVNTDALDLPDYLDTDSDNDGYSDFIEGYDTNNDKVADIAISGLDTDADGLDDVFDNVNGINPSTNVTNGGQTSDDFPNLDQPLTAERDWREKLDTDGDGVADFFDVDNDNDGILDVDESDCNNPQVLFTGMVDAFWAMDNSTNDISGNNRNAGAGTVAPTFTTDAVQGTHAAEFNGTNQKVRYSVDNGFMESDYTQVSFSAWIKPNSLTGTRIIYEEGAGTNGLTLWLSGNTLRYSARSGSNQINLVHIETLALDNAWHHVACTFNEGLMSLYFDGEVVTIMAPYTSIPPHGSDGGVGGDFAGTAANVTGNYSGLLDAARYSFTEAWPSSRIVYESQRLCDSDGDGVFDRFDLDSDNDGIPDIIEAGGVDVDGDGRVDAFVDTDGDGWADTFDPDNGGTPLTDDDIDGDGYPNRLDLDSDNDGLTDNVEAQTTAAFQALSGLDTDGDGWDDSYDSDNGGTAISLSDADSDGIPDYLDMDADGDGLPDWIEGFDDNGSGDALDDFIIRADDFELAAGNPLFYVNTDDADTDGIPDWLEDDDANDLPNFLDPAHPLYRDSDGDGLIDLYDTDNFGVPSNLPDLDGDGEYDFRDTDDQISLPITLLYFNAIKQGEQVLLTWATSSEINNDYFTIERSSDARNYKPILEHPGAGNSQMEIQYQRFDKTPLQGNNYYRLRQTDFDGKTDVTSPKVVYFSTAIEAIEIYPNPNGADELYLMFTNLAVGNYRFKIQDIQGKLHRDELFNIGKEERKVVKVMRGMSTLAKGTYIISITGENFVRHLKYIQQ